MQAMSLGASKSQEGFLNTRFPIYQQPTLTSENIPPVLRAPYIRTGYRLPHQPWSYYVKSLIYLDNDSANVWTHAIGAIIAGKIMWDIVQSEDFLTDKDEWTMLGFTIGCFMIMFLSAMAHLFHLKSIWWHHVLYMFDYSGVTLYDFGTGLGYSYISSHKAMYNNLEPFLLPFNMAFSLITFYTCCKARVEHKHRTRVAKMAAAYSSYAFLVAVPVLARYVDCFFDPDCSLASLNHMTMPFLLMGLCMATYGAHLPERVCTGRFDIIGHSHSVFHVVGMATLGMQMRGFRQDILSGAASHTSPSLVHILSAYLVLVSAQVLTLVWLRHDINRRVREDTDEWEKTRDKRR